MKSARTPDASDRGRVVVRRAGHYQEYSIL
jgi:hypothetical protein